MRQFAHLCTMRNPAMSHTTERLSLLSRHCPTHLLKVKPTVTLTISLTSVAASAGAGGGGFADFANFDGSASQPAMTPHSMGPGRDISETPSSVEPCFLCISYICKHTQV